MKPSNQRLVASILKSLSLIDHCIPSTIQTTHVSLFPKAVGFIIEEFSTRTKFAPYRDLFLKVVFRNLSVKSILYSNPHVIAT